MTGTLLLLSADPDLALTRTLVLESAGFSVISVDSFQEAESIIRLQKPPMIILCQSLGGPAQAHYIEELRKFPEAPRVLSLQASLLDPQTSSRSVSN